MRRIGRVRCTGRRVHEPCDCALHLPDGIVLIIAVQHVREIRQYPVKQGAPVQIKYIKGLARPLLFQFRSTIDLARALESHALQRATLLSHG